MCLMGLLGAEASRMPLLAADIAHSLEVVCLDAAVLDRVVGLFSRAVLFAPAAFVDWVLRCHAASWTVVSWRAVSVVSRRPGSGAVRCVRLVLLPIGSRAVLERAIEFRWLVLALVVLEGI